MKITLGLIADSANISLEGKLNILGIFDTIHAMKFPCRNPQMTLITKIETELTDSHDISRDIKIILEDEDANELFSISGNFNFKNSPPGERGTTSSIITLTDLVFEKPGNFSFKISIGAEVMADIPLKLREMPKKA